MAADTAGEQLCDVYVLSTRASIRDVDGHAVSAPPPPTLTSARYATDFNEVKLLGSVNSAVRPADVTLWTQVHAGVNTQIGFFHVWNRVAGDVAQRYNLSLVDTARTFVLLTVGLHDGLQTSFTSKFTYGLWRPVTAIRRASEDLNPATDQEDSWTPLLTTPTYPAYAGNVACLSAASARALQIAFDRDDIPFTVIYPRTMGLPTETRDLRGLLGSCAAGSRQSHLWWHPLPVRQ